MHDVRLVYCPASFAAFIGSAIFPNVGQLNESAMSRDNRTELSRGSIREAANDCHAALCHAGGRA